MILRIGFRCGWESVDDTVIILTLTVVAHQRIELFCQVSELYIVQPCDGAADVQVRLHLAQRKIFRYSRHSALHI